MLSLTVIAFFHLLFLGSVTADSGDDFSNNLFTDLGPLLALFGERVTMQFLSQAMGWSDCIILATAPLGIITIIVAAIRVGGPSWLKALIGRATENIATAELELMSSTSKEVCELWNGKDVVRCAGSAPIWEFICLLPRGGMPENPVVKVLKIEEAEEQFYITRKSLNGETSFWNKIRTYLQPLGDNHVNNEENCNAPPPPADEVIIIRNTQHPVPNISHNRSKNTGRGELYLAACFGIILQIGVLLYCGFITQYSKITSGFQKNEQPVGGYAFPLIVIGTVFLDIGMLICSHVVESSTQEEIFIPAEDWRARLVWLQQEKTVGDQEFKSFALFTKEDQPTVITSSRVGQVDRQHDQGMKKTDSDDASEASEKMDSEGTINSENNRATARDTPVALEVKTVLGTIIGLIGFFAQFIGIRGMHWSVSVASLIAVLIMTAVRAWVRRGLTTPVLSVSLIPQYELDWFADTFKDLKNASWYQCSKDMKDEKAGSSGGKALDFTNESVINEKDDARSQAVNSDSIDVQTFDLIRQHLAKLAGWQGPVSQEAVKVTRAIEATMDILDGYFQAERDSRFPHCWSHNVRIGELEDQTLIFHLYKQGSKWKANAGEIEAALSLRLFYAKDNQKKIQSTVGALDKYGGPLDDTWLRSSGNIAESGIKILGRRTMPVLRHLEWWMPADGPKILKVENIAFEISHANASGNRLLDAIESIYAGSKKSETVEIEESRVFGLDSCQIEDLGVQNSDNISSHLQLSPSYFRTSHKTRWKFEISKEESEDSNYVKIDNSLLATESQDALEILYARDIFSVFVGAVAKSLVSPIGNKTDIQTQSFEDQDAWKSFTLHNDKISRLAQAVQSTGLCSIHEAFISIIPPLSVQQKLPEAGDVVELIRSRTEELEKLQNWKAAGKVYLWLSDRKVAFGIESQTYARAVAVLLAFLTTLQDTLKRRNIEQIRSDTWSLGNVEKEINKTMKNVDTELWHNLESLCEFQDENGAQIRVENISGEFRLKYQKWLFISADIYQKESGHSYPKWTSEDAKARDIFDRTPLHYFAAFTYDADRHINKQNEEDEEDEEGRETEDGNKFPEDEVDSRRFHLKMQNLIETGADLNGCDIRGWTPLHYACRADNISMARLLLEKGASIDIQGRDGTAPIHCAAVGGHLKMVKVLLEFGAAIDIADSSGSTTLHLAAFRGSAETVELLCQRNCRKLRDKWGRAALHLAAITSQTAVIDQLADDASFEDYEGKTPLHLASKCGQNSFVKRLLEIPGVDKMAFDVERQTPLHLAAEAGHQTVVQSLIESDPHITNLDIQDSRDQTPLHLACLQGHDAVVEFLLDAGATIDAKASDDMTPLHYAALHRESTVRLLIARNASVDIADWSGQTALHFAAEKGNAAIFQHLLEQGADINAGAQTVTGTPLHLASISSDNNPVVPLILAIPEVRIDETDSGGETPLHEAAFFCRQEHVKQLCNHGANMEARDNDGRTPLHLVVQGTGLMKMLGKEKELARMLIRLGADVNATDNSGSTPLHLAAKEEEKAEVILELLEGEAEINQTNKAGCTPLHLAAKKKRLECIQLLIEHGANVEAVNKDGKTPQMLADERDTDWWVKNISR